MSHHSSPPDDARRFLLCVIALTFVCCSVSTLFAGDYCDDQGSNISSLLRKEFPIPIDGMSDNPVPGAYWLPYKYWDWSSFSGVRSSEIVIYGVKDKAVQDLILKRIKELKDQRRMLITFYDDSRFTKHYDANGHGSSRLPSQLLRQELLK